MEELINAEWMDKGSLFLMPDNRKILHSRRNSFVLLLDSNSIGLVTQKKYNYLLLKIRFMYYQFAPYIKLFVTLFVTLLHNII